MQIHMETASDYRSRAVTRTVEYSWLRVCEAARLRGCAIKPLQAFQEFARHSHAVIEAWRVFQRSDSVKSSSQTGMRLPNLSQEDIPMAQQEWLRRQKLLRLSLDHKRQIK